MTRRLALVVNPTSGNGRGARWLDQVCARLRRDGTGVDVVAGRDGDEAFDRLRDRVAAGVDGVVAVGGDGLVNIALQVVGGTDVPLGVVPAGTGNDIARALGIVPGDPAAAVDLVRLGRTRRLDLGRANGRWFAGVLGSGLRLDGQRARQPHDLAQRAQPLQPGDPRRAADLPPRAVRPRARRGALGDRRDAGRGGQRSVVRRGDAGLPRRRSWTTGCSTSPCWARSPSRSSCGCSRRSTSGTHVEHPAVTVRRARTVTLRAEDVTAYADGERVSRAAGDLRDGARRAAGVRAGERDGGDRDVASQP